MPPTETNRIENAWAIHQVQTTVDSARRSRLAAWLLGGLDFQIEHHMFQLQGGRVRGKRAGPWETEDRSGLRAMREQVVDRLPAVVENCPVVLGDRNDHRLSLFHKKSGGMRANSAQSLDNDARAPNPGLQAESAHLRVERARLSYAVEHSETRGLFATTDAPERDGLTCHASDCVQFVVVQLLIGVDHPCHLASAGAEVGCRRVNAGADEVLLREFETCSGE